MGESELPLPSPREAMLRAHMLLGTPGSGWEASAAMATAWIAFARELREGATPPPPPPPPPPLTGGVLKPAPPVDENAENTGVIQSQRLVPGYLDRRPAEGQAAQCRCGEPLIYHEAKWIHRRTYQAVCPTPNRTAMGDETYVHTFADPRP